MHYKNKREAHEGEPVVGRNSSGKTFAGVIHSIELFSDTYVCAVAIPVPGGVIHEGCISVGELYHAEDALKAVDSLPAENPTPLVGIPVENTTPPPSEPPPAGTF